jgi:transcription initiation factor IIE alpha subunit
MTELNQYQMNLVFCSCGNPSAELSANSYGTSIRYPNGEPVFSGFTCHDCGELLNNYALRPANHLELYTLKREVEKLEGRLNLAVPF